MEHWGYYLLPKSHPESPGYTGLLVAIREKPAGEHFDPESMHLRIIEKDKETSWATLKSEAFFNKSIRVGLGQLLLRDKIDERVTFFTFGGILETASIPGETVYSLRSLAPILNLNGSLESVADQLAFETEAELAEQEARWGLNENGFLLRLTQVDPFELYLACLHSILQRYQQSPGLQRSYNDFYVALLKEKKWLLEMDQYPNRPPDLDQIFAPN